VRIRILPFVFLLFVVALLDRVNIGFAGLTMNKELAITSQQYGLIFGIRHENREPLRRPGHCWGAFTHVSDPCVAPAKESTGTGKGLIASRRPAGLKMLANRKQSGSLRQIAISNNVGGVKLIPSTPSMHSEKSAISLWL